ncbi:MAG: indole-3-glycerol phosphate synthase TrpC [Campylobacter sp.]|nr:indole-3-glycerol phosphate synthase TrpC [Campylobacter sp.]
MILDEIVAKTKKDLEIAKSKVPFDTLARSIASVPFTPREVKSALRKSSDDPIKIIAEVKKASPSRGVIREDFDPIDIAINYQNGGANALSILTEPHFFLGDLEYLSAIRRYTSIPLLRKDFIVDRYQILQAYIYGADFILLIAKVLSKNELKEFLNFALDLGLDALVEIHDKDDLTKAIFVGADIIGINHRNLDDFSMNMSLSKELIPLIPNGKIIVAESGLKTSDDLKALSEIGVDAFLIGETFMRQGDVKQALKEIKGY